MMCLSCSFGGYARCSKKMKHCEMCDCTELYAGWSIYDVIKLKRDPNKRHEDAPYMSLGMSLSSMHGQHAPSSCIDTLMEL